MERGAGMNHQLIQKVVINWEKIHRGSYLRDIEAIKGLEEIEFTSPITFLLGKMGAENLRCWKQWLLPADLIRKGEAGITAFPPMIPTRSFAGL